MNGRELNTKAVLHSSIDDDAFHKDWIRLGPRDVDFSSYVSIDNMWLFQRVMIM
jgi:hypothetical protein